MRITVQNQITGEPKLADVEVDDLKVHVRLVDEPIEFTCKSISENMSNSLLNWIFSDLHKDWCIGLSNWEILDANTTYTQSIPVQQHKFVKEMEEGKSDLARLLRCT